MSRDRPLGAVPAELRDAHYRGARALGHGVGYEYPHDDPRGFVEAAYLPEGLAGRRYYEPSEHGAEKMLAERWRARRAEPSERGAREARRDRRREAQKRPRLRHEASAELEGPDRDTRLQVNADQVRNTFTTYFVERGHLALPAASLVPNDPSMLFTIAGMVQFKPYLLAESPPPGPRATTVQPCVRTVDIDVIGTTSRHVTFFEMMGNFSFGDYFKELAIEYAWELLTDGLGLDPVDLWVTVHISDDEAEAIWHEVPGLLDGRLQRLDEDNFWKMGETGPCGPSSEIFFDRGPQYGPARRTGSRRGALRRDLEPRVHAVRPPCRRLAHRAAPAQHRHRSRARPHPDAACRASSRSSTPTCRTDPRGGVRRDRSGIRQH